MDRARAEEFAAAHRRYCDWFNDVTELSDHLPDASAKQLRRAMAELLFALDDAVQRPLRREHPDLFPEADAEG